MVSEAKRVPGVHDGPASVWLASTEGSIALASEDVPAAQAAFLHRARMNSAAAAGRWSPEVERGGP